MSNSLTDLSQKFTQWSSRIEQNKDELEYELERWKGYKEEYDALGKQLDTLADETSRTAMIPFGTLAFMPGKLIHTNEIMVYLGDQYYVERSTKQALAILNRRKEAVNENLNLVQAQWNAVKAKSDSVNNNLFPSGDGVNEEGLPIMEIREEIPSDEMGDNITTITLPPTNDASSSSSSSSAAAAATETETKATTISKDTRDESDTSDTNNLMAMLDALEEEEEEEERLKQQLTFEQQLTFNEPDNTNEEIDYDEEDLEDLYDTEVADNIFDHFEDDEEYATQGVVDQEDWTARDDLDDHDTKEQLDTGNGVNNSLPEEPIKDVVEERLDNPITSSPPAPTPSLKEDTKSTTSMTHQPVEKKISRFKKLQMEKQNTDTIASTVDTTTITDDESKKPLSSKPKFKVLKQGERKRKLEQQQQLSPPPESPESIPQVMPSKPNNTKSNISATTETDEHQQQPLSPDITTSPPPEQPKKKVSKFKQFQEQQRQTQRTSPPPVNLHDESPKKPTSKPTNLKGTPIDVPSRNIPSKPITTTTTFTSTSKSTSTSTTTTTTTNTTTADNDSTNVAGKKKVSWESTTSVREHDRLSAPTTDPRDTYDKPLKAGHDTEKTTSVQHTIRSPSDIFRVVKQHQPTILAEMGEDGYPTMDINDDTASSTMKMDLRELASSVSLSDPEPMWRPNYEVDEDKLPLNRPWRPTTQTLVQPKSKMDTTTMRGAVMEREAEDLDLDEVEDDMDFKEIKSSYQRQRQGMLATMGGLSFDPKPEFEVFDEDLPLPSGDDGNNDEAAAEVPRKMSRFKAARMGLASNEEQ